MKKNKIGICGHFGGNNVFLDGQTIKTKAWKAALEFEMGNEIKYVDTYNWRKRKVKLIVECLQLAKKCEHIIILPARPGIKIILPIFLIGKLFFKCKVHYMVIGGWIAEYLKENIWLWALVKKVDGVYTEGNIVLNKLVEMELKNVCYLPNFKNITPLKEEQLTFSSKSPYRLCTFSRILREKGIEDAIKVIQQINAESKEIVYELDIYGPIDEKYKEEFELIIGNFPDYITYKGMVPENNAVEILSKYFMLLFPTRYPGEGLPGTILDAYAAGLPVLASRWNSYCDIIDENKTGITYELYNIEQFKYKLEEILENPQIVLNMKKECIEKANAFLPKKIINQFLTIIEG